jgi:hypothetical protein
LKNRIICNSAGSDSVVDLLQLGLGFGKETLHLQK